MSLLAAAPIVGQQHPRILSRPPFATEESGVEAIELAASVGLHLDPWQQLAVKVALAEGPDQRWAAREVAILASRQQGKNVVLEAIELYALFVAGDHLTLASSHHFKTTVEAFRRFKSWIDGSDDLRRRVKSMATSTGNEGVELINGARIRFIARSRSSGRGWSPTRVILDEAQQLPILAVEAVLPSLSAQPNPQMILTGTKPTEHDESEYWEGLRDRGRRGGDKRLAWLEWTPEGSGEVETAEAINLDDPEVWAQANPGLGYRLQIETIQAERASLIQHPQSFAGQRLSIWPSGTAVAAVIKDGAWNARKADPPTEGIRSYGIKYSVDGSRVALAGARKWIDGNDQVHVFVEVIDEGPTSLGNGPLVQWLVDRWRKAASIVIDGRSGSQALYDALRAQKVPEALLVKMTAENATAAAAALVSAVVGGTVEHSGQEGLNASVRGAGRRAIGNLGGWGFGPIAIDADVTPLDAVAAAHYGAISSKRNPDRRSSISV